MNKAFFFDRDGIVMEMVYDLDVGKITIPLKKDDVNFVFGIFDLLKETSKLGYLNILVSNQPDMSLKKISQKNFDQIREKMLNEFEKSGVKLDGEYYCFHHPFAKIKKLRVKCVCRKPEPGLLLQAAKDQKIDLKKSIMIGDGVNDILAGHKVGAKTILVGNIIETEFLRIVENRLKGVRPDFLVKKLSEVPEILKKI